MAKGRFNSYKLRKWSILVRWRDRKCQICGSRERLQAHHINDKSYHPNEAYNIENGVALCAGDKKDGNKCHIRFHVMFMGSFRKKCTRKDFEKFLELINWVKEF